MARNLREVIAAVAAERRAKVAAAYRQKLIALKKKRQLEEAKRVLELDSNLIAIAVIITALPIIAALGWMLTARRRSAWTRAPPAAQFATNSTDDTNEGTV